MVKRRRQTGQRCQAHRNGFALKQISDCMPKVAAVCLSLLMFSYATYAISHGDSASGDFALVLAVVCLSMCFGYNVSLKIGELLLNLKHNLKQRK